MKLLAEVLSSMLLIKRISKLNRDDGYYFKKSTKLLLSLFILASPNLALALSQSDLSYELRTGNNVTGIQLLVNDSNQCATDGPGGAYAGVKITNSTGSTLTDLQATLSGFDTANGFGFAGGQVATQFVGSLNAGESRSVYWYVTKPCTFDLTDTLTVTLSDAGVGTSTYNFDIKTGSFISANAGGLITSSTLGPGAVVGQTIDFTVDYSFGNTAIGDEFYIQPAGNLGYDAACFQLTGSEVIGGDLTSMPIGSTDVFWFKSTAKQTGSGHVASIKYFLTYKCANTTTAASPYAAQTSGSTNLKYTGNFDDPLVAITFPTASNPFSVTKTVTPDTFANGTGGTVTYTVTVTNNSAFDSIVDEIKDTLPTGVIYGGLTGSSGVTSANSSSIPTSGATGAISWLGKPTTSYKISAGNSLSVVYTATIPATNGSYTNSVLARTGQSETTTASSNVIVGTAADLSISKTLDTSGPYISGQTVTYTITVSNAGPGIATNIVVTDLPTNLIITSATGPNSSCTNTPASGITTLVDCTISSLAIGASANEIITLQATVP